MCAYNLEKALKHIGIQVFGTGECVRDCMGLSPMPAIPCDGLTSNLAIIRVLLVTRIVLLSFDHIFSD